MTSEPTITITLNHAKHLLGICGKYGITLVEMVQKVSDSEEFTPELMHASLNEFNVLRENGDALSSAIEAAEPGFQADCKARREAEEAGR